MSDKPNGHTHGQRVITSADIKPALYAAIGAQCNCLVMVGLPTTDIINTLLDVAANLLAGIEPAGLRQNIIEEIKRNFPTIVEQQWNMRHSSPGGIIRPPS